MISKTFQEFVAGKCFPDICENDESEFHFGYKIVLNEEGRGDQINFKFTLEYEKKLLI